MRVRAQKLRCRCVRPTLRKCMRCACGCGRKSAHTKCALLILLVETFVSQLFKQKMFTNTNPNSLSKWSNYPNSIREILAMSQKLFLQFWQSFQVSEKNRIVQGVWIFSWILEKFDKKLINCK